MTTPFSSSKDRAPTACVIVQVSTQARQRTHAFGSWTIDGPERRASKAQEARSSGSMKPACSASPATKLWRHAIWAQTPR